VSNRKTQEQTHSQVLPLNHIPDILIGQCRVQVKNGVFYNDKQVLRRRSYIQL